MEALETVDIDPDPEGSAPAAGGPPISSPPTWSGWMPSRCCPERRYAIRLANVSAVAQVTDLAHRIDVDTLGRMATKTLGPNEIGYCKLSLGPAGRARCRGRRSPAGTPSS